MHHPKRGKPLQNGINTTRNWGTRKRFGVVSFQPPKRRGPAQLSEPPTFPSPVWWTLVYFKAACLAATAPNSQASALREAEVERRRLLSELKWLQESRDKAPDLAAGAKSQIVSSAFAKSQNRKIGPTPFASVSKRPKGVCGMSCFEAYPVRGWLKGNLSVSALEASGGFLLVSLGTPKWYPQKRNIPTFHLRFGRHFLICLCRGRTGGCWVRVGGGLGGGVLRSFLWLAKVDFG